MKLTVVGCSGSTAGPASAASCYLVQAPDRDGRIWRVLLDLGSGALGPLWRYCDPRQVDAVLLSHLHPDHCLDVTGLYVALRYDPRLPPSPSRGMPQVWGPSGVEARLACAYDPVGGGAIREHGADLGDQLTFGEWVDGSPVTVGPLQVVPVAVQHPVEAYGLRITWRRDATEPAVVLGYSGDSGPCAALDTVAAAADLFLCEAAFVDGVDDGVVGVHLTGGQAGEVAARAGAGRLMLTHIPPWNQPEVALAAAAAAYPGPIDLAAPGSVWSGDQLPV